MQTTPGEIQLISNQVMEDLRIQKVSTSVLFSLFIGQINHDMMEPVASFTTFSMIWFVLHDLACANFFVPKDMVAQFFFVLFFTRNWTSNWSKNDFLLKYMPPLPLVLSLQWVVFREINSFRPLEENEGSKNSLKRRCVRRDLFSKVKSQSHRKTISRIANHYLLIVKKHFEFYFFQFLFRDMYSATITSFKPKEALM